MMNLRREEGSEKARSGEREGARGGAPGAWLVLALGPHSLSFKWRGILENGDRDAHGQKKSQRQSSSSALPGRTNGACTAPLRDLVLLRTTGEGWAILPSAERRQLAAT